MIKFDYSILKGKITEKYGSQYNFAKVIELNKSVLNNRLNHKNEFSANEIFKISSLLKEDDEDIISAIGKFFFCTAKVEKVQPK